MQKNAVLETIQTRIRARLSHVFRETLEEVLRSDFPDYSLPGNCPLEIIFISLSNQTKEDIPGRIESLDRADRWIAPQGSIFTILHRDMEDLDIYYVVKRADGTEFLVADLNGNLVFLEEGGVSVEILRDLARDILRGVVCKFDTEGDVIDPFPQGE
ncbi:MAG TPA: hypothetical protein PKA31_01505 [Candidatus Moranbacteria bacterium]|nr:hypothetical protein [Candidatus Moranbacteria bacterium]